MNVVDEPYYSEKHQDPYSPCETQDYILSEGALVTVHAGEEVKHDFTLKENPFKDCSIISGIVKDCHGKGIIHGIVKVFDQHHKPITHAFTNEDGEFLICVPPGTYIIKAVR